MTRLAFSPGYPREGFEDVRRELGRWLDAWGARAPQTWSAGVHPPVNLYDTSDGVVLTAELPGLRQEDLDISIEQNRVTLRGERRIEPPDGQKANLHRRERRSGVFRRAVELPFAIDAEKAEASYRNGVLRVRLPKRPEDQPRQIKIAAR